MRGIANLYSFSFVRNLPGLEPLSNRPFLLPKQTRSSPNITLVLDLDETLVHCSTIDMPEKDLEFTVEFAGEKYRVTLLLVNVSGLRQFPAPLPRISKPFRKNV